MCNSANKAARSRPLFLVFFFSCLSFFWGGTRACVSVRMRVPERKRERERLCVSVSVSAKCVCLVLECTQKEK